MPKVFVVHAVDTEGPLDESLEGTFERLWSIYGLRITPSATNLALIQQRRADFVPEEIAGEVAKTFSPANLRYNSNWKEIDLMNKEVFSAEYRNRYLDSSKNPWAISWFVMDHENYLSNPRGKEIGQGGIHRPYQSWIKSSPHVSDEIQYHFHPTSLLSDPLAAATSYTKSLPRAMSDLAMRLCEFDWFPSVFRPGFHSVRSDSNLWIEQWFPFDFSNQAYEEEEHQPDLIGGRFGDWRGAPLTWRGYKPSVSNYSMPGALKRTVFRCLNLGTRHKPLTTEHVQQAFVEALAEGSAVLAFTDHDFRDIRPDILEMHQMLTSVGAQYPEVTFHYLTASEAARRLLGLSSKTPILEAKIDNQRLRVNIKPLETHSHQPFLGVKTSGGQYLHDNFDRGSADGEFSYTFDQQTIKLEDVEKIGVATVGLNGKVATKILKRDIDFQST